MNKPRKLRMIIPKQNLFNEDKTEEIEELWKTISNGIQQILVIPITEIDISIEEIFRSCYRLIEFDKENLLINRFKMTIEEYANEQINFFQSQDDSIFLTTFHEKWNSYRLKNMILHELFQFLNNMFLSRTNNNTFSIYQNSMKKWRSQILTTNDNFILLRLIRIINENINQERNGEVTDMSFLKDIIQMFIDVSDSNLDIYTNFFENKYLNISSLYYQMESQDLLLTNNCGIYLNKVQERLKEEEIRAAQYFNTQTFARIQSNIINEFLKPYIQTLMTMDNGLNSMMSKEDFGHLKLMYHLFTKVPNGTETLLQVFLDLHSKRLTEIIQENKKKIVGRSPPKFIDHLINQRTQYSEIIDKSFSKNKDFHIAINAQFKTLINQTKDFPEQLAKYLDRCFRFTFLSSNEEEIGKIMDSIIIIFSLLNNKDIFKRFYEQFFAKRFLSGSSVSENIEKMMIAKIKKIQGKQFTQKMETMLNDIHNSEQETIDFKKFLTEERENDPITNIVLNFRVLTQGQWPGLIKTECQLIPELQEYCDIFTGFYIRKHDGRVLTWKFSIGSAEIAYSMNNKKYTLITSTFQMLILLLLHKKNEKISIEEIMEETKIEEPILINCIKPLFHPKHKLLTRAFKKGKGFNKEDQLVFYPRFKSNTRRVMFPRTIRTQEKRERLKTIEKIHEERKLIIDATIVRIMKSRKSLIHNLLITEITSQLANNFVPSISSIKKRIDSLIEREYIERDINDIKLYKYLA
ncbi:cullin [Anaeramoeba flamelloides]|uniref:Cullin n=1 Tax=Anaeramoeba flamelloides TaxID=1746091 RepID=A0AAV8A882_9EUKA|nr:cullin [Anaeramoeba flamelloides]